MRILVLFCLACGTAAQAGAMRSWRATTRAAAAMTAASPAWIPIGPAGLAPPKGDTGVQGGAVNAVAADPANPNVMLIASQPGGGIHRTHDGGRSWQPAVAGLLGAGGLTAGTIGALWMNPARSAEVLAASEHDGIFRSADGGATWTSVLQTTGAGSFAALGSSLFAGSAKGVLLSTNAGRTWTLALPTHAPVLTVATGGDTAAAGARDGTVYRYRGGSWTRAGAAPAAVHALAIDPQKPSVVYASVQNGPYNYNLYASLDGGASWSKIAWDKALLGCQALAFSAIEPHRLYVAGDGATVWTAADGNPEPAWTRAATTGDIRALVIRPNAERGDDRCLVASDQGLQIAETCSKAKTPVNYANGGLSTTLVTDFAVSPDGKTIAATMTDFPSAGSSDGGSTWSFLTMAGQGGGENGFVAFNPRLANQCIHFRKGIHVSMDGCGHFSETDKAISFVSSSGNYLAFDPASPSTFYAVALTPPAILKTTDGGASFQQLGWPMENPFGVVVAPSNGRHLIAVAAGSVSVSFDGGQSWAAAKGLPKPVKGGTVAIHPRDERTVFATWPEGGALKAYRSRDGGRTFQLTSVIAPPGTWQSGIAKAVYGTARRAGLVVTTLNGAFLSADDGDSWQRLDASMTTHHFSSAQWVDHRLYLGTYGEGIIRSGAPLE